MSTAYIDSMVTAYVECLLWAGLDWSPTERGEDNPIPLDENYDADDMSVDALESIRAECVAFYDANAVDLADIDAEQAGHDLYLTRNHHGAGFWDRGLGDIGRRLTDAAHVYGESGEWVGEDGKIHVE